jgi:hypothetical protein
MKSQEADREDLRKRLDVDYAFRQQQELKARSLAARERAQREAFRRADKEHAVKTRMAEVADSVVVWFCGDDAVCSSRLV